MIFKKDTIEKILGINDDVALTAEKMAENLQVTFFPVDNSKVNSQVIDFAGRLKKSFLELGVKVIPYEESLITPPLNKFIKHLLRILWVNFLMLFKKNRYFFRVKIGRKIKKGVAIIMVGDGKDYNLPMDNTISFKYNPIVTIIEKANHINQSSTFQEHMDLALNLFARHMTNLLVTVSDKDWTTYSFNASYPTHSIDKNFSQNILNSLIPKISAPVRPPKFYEFIVNEDNFNAEDKNFFTFSKDLISSGPLFEKTSLYPKGKKIEELNFRNNFYRWVGSLHLDKRNGMSYGFLARQLPVKLSIPIKLENLDNDIKEKIDKDKQYFYYKDELYLYFNLYKEDYILKVPDVWVLTSRSGSDKTHLSIKKDILRVGLLSGKMILDLPTRLKDMKSQPSFDTRIILSHAVANAIFASILVYFRKDDIFSKQLSENGMALAHWHGYVNPEYIKNGWNVYGYDKPPVSCSSSQSAIYAFMGKQKGILECLDKNKDYIGDIHIEPQHGTNMTYISLLDLARFFIDNPNFTKLGNEYLDLYKNFNKNI